LSGSSPTGASENVSVWLQVRGVDFVGDELEVQFYEVGTLLLAYHEDWAVGVPDDGLGDTAQQRPAYRAQTPAADHYHANA
jgi:hypothetical protein